MKKKMNTKEKLSVIALFLLIAIIAVTTIALFFLKKPNDDTKEQVEVTETPQPEATAEPTAEPTEQNFELLESKAPTNQGITNYSKVSKLIGSLLTFSLKFSVLLFVQIRL